jgi:hypothetical protein
MVSLYVSQEMIHVDTYQMVDLPSRFVIPRLDTLGDRHGPSITAGLPRLSTSSGGCGSPAGFASGAVTTELGEARLLERYV